MRHPVDLSRIAPGFEHEAMGSQRVFRTVMQALSHPGQLQDFKPLKPLTPAPHSPAALALLALLDADCRLWLSPRLAACGLADWLRFHTGCMPASRAGDAQFCWVGLGDALPELDTLELGSDADPHRAATLLIDVAGFAAGSDAACWSLRGPGIADAQALAVQGLPRGFGEFRARNHALFPRGVDMLLAAPDALVGLPRTTRVEPAALAAEV